MSETVYVLGSGFSVCGGAPLQSGILNDLYSGEYQFEEIQEHHNVIKSFLEDTFNLDFTMEEKARKNFQLEDLFLVLDRCILNKESFNNRTENEIIAVRKSLEVCINNLIAKKVNRRNANFYKKLSEKIVKKRIEALQEKDPFCFINLNWDIILDNALYRTCNEFNEKGDEVDPKCFIDYCCYTTPFDKENKDPISLFIKAKGHFNLKIQKLHGSMNWVHCSNCGRLLYTALEKSALWDVGKGSQEICPYCKEGILHSVIIAPTYIKDIGNTHLKMVWHNALLDLMEADRVVFIGYSLPPADLDFRYILKKGIGHDAKIEVVLIRDRRYTDIKANYKMFFGNQIKDNNFHTEGSCKFFAKEFGFDFVDSDCYRNKANRKFCNFTSQMNYLTDYINQIKLLCDKHDVKSLFAFGSVTTEKFTPESDIDLLIDIDSSDPIDYTDNYFAVKFQLEKILKRQIDLLEQKSLRNPYLKKQINQTKVRVYGR